jgi:hypothetical protein
VSVTTRIPAVLDYLYNTFYNAATLGAATPPVSVYDGPVPTGGADTLILWVGVSDPQATPPEAGASAHEWAGLGKMAINETLSVFCTAFAWTGTESGTFKAARDAANGIMSAVEDIVRGDASLGGTVQTPGNAQVTNAVWTQGPTTAGPSARVTFEITAKARIGG